MNEPVKNPRYLGGELYGDGETWRSVVGVPDEWEAVYAVQFSKVNGVLSCRLVSVTRDMGSPTEHDLRQAEGIATMLRAREAWEAALSE